MDGELERLQNLLTEQYVDWRTNTIVDHGDPTAKFVAQLAQLVIAMAAIQRGASNGS